MAPWSNAASAAVEAERARARAASIRQSYRDAQCAPRPVIERRIGVVEPTDFGTKVVFERVAPS